MCQSHAGRFGQDLRIFRHTAIFLQGQIKTNQITFVQVHHFQRRLLSIKSQVALIFAPNDSLVLVCIAPKYHTIHHIPLSQHPSILIQLKPFKHGKFGVWLLIFVSERIASRPIVASHLSLLSVNELKSPRKPLLRASNPTID